MCGLAENVDQQEMEQSGCQQGWGMTRQVFKAGTGICFPNFQFSPELAAADVWLGAEFVLEICRENQSLWGRAGVKDLGRPGDILTS